MLIIKSFFRKKTTKKYIIIFCLLICIFSFILIGRDYYFKLDNDNTKNSFLEFIAPKNQYYEILNLQNVEEVSINIIASFEEGIIYLEKGNKEINFNSVLIPETFKDKFNINDKITINYNDNNYLFNIKGYFNAKKNNTLMINSDLFQQISKDTQNVLYRISLKKWFKRDTTIKKIRKKIKYDENYDILAFTIRDKNINFDDEINFFNIVSIALIILYCIIFIFIIYNIIIDEKGINKLLYYLGYDSHKIKIITSSKILLLFLMCFIIVLLISGIILFILNKLN